MAGVVTVKGPLVRWAGIVVGGDEQYIINANGFLIDSRRIRGVSWARRLDRADPWMRVPSDPRINLAALLRGSDVHSDRDGEDWRISLRFDHVDVLAALTHVPSTGPSTATVTLRGEVIAEVALHLTGDANAELSFWDYGAALAVEPVVPSSLATAAARPR